MGTERIKSFKDLVAWQESRGLAIDIYLLTKTFPSSEMFGLTSQMRRAAVSIGSNIAEGFSRQYKEEKCQFYSIAIGSLTELLHQVFISEGVGYVDSPKREKLEESCEHIGKLIQGLFRSVQSRPSPNTKY